MESQSPPPFAQPVMQLAYADLPARHGIIFEQSAGCATISIPVPLSRQVMAMGGFVIIIALAIHLFVALLVFAIVLGIALYKKQLGRPIVITLTAQELRIDNMMPGHPEPSVRYDRADVYDVHYVSHSNFIVIHARGREMLELRPSRDKRVLIWIADTLRQQFWPATSPQS